MKTTKQIMLIALILSTITSSYASSTIGDDPENPLTTLPGETTEPEFYNCIHQESKLSKHGLIYLTAYKYAVVMEDEHCPPFSNVYEHPLNEVTTEDIVWGGLAEPELPGQAHCDVPDPEPIECGPQIGPDGFMNLCYIPPQNCQYSEVDHTCRWGLSGGGNLF